MKVTTVTAAEAAARLTQHNDILILTHRRPDGDTLGSAHALCRLLRQKGLRAFLHHNEDATPRLAPLLDGLTAPQGFEPHFVVAVDIASENLFLASCDVYRGKVDLCIDHHPSNTGYAREVLLDGQAAATGELIWTLAGLLGLAPGREAMHALYIAVATDTGCFCFSNTTPLAHRIAADCIEAGVDVHAVNREFFERKSHARFQIERRLFDTLRFYENNRVAAAVLERDFAESVGASGDDLDNLSTLIMQLDGVECAILLQELPQRGEYKVSLRTQKPLNASSICAAFGGGGHARAAGCTVRGDAVQCRDMLAREAVRQMEMPC